jgi:hypothetical protein
LRLETPNQPHIDVAATAESKRLAKVDEDGWRKWGPYLAERQWGTVREDYSDPSDPWSYFPHDHARSRAYRWGEDGVGGFCDQDQNLCLAPAFWNGRDPILKERLFGLNNAEGNHGEDVKELYYFLDATPTHSYMRMLYKYPQREFPYRQLVEENARRSLTETEFELLDTGIFDDDAYFDIEIEYAKSAASDVLMRVTARNRGSESARLHILTQLWARNTWSWGDKPDKPHIEALGKENLRILDVCMPVMFAEFPGADELVFCENETNTKRLYDVAMAGFCKDGINEYLVNGDHAAINPNRFGTKCAAIFARDIPPGGVAVVHASLRESNRPYSRDEFDAIFELRRREADEFYSALQIDIQSEDARLVQRQALAGLLWSKQFYCFDVRRWISGDPGQPAPPPNRKGGRNHDWPHLALSDVISMPDTWEYPWFAAWDLAFHCEALALVDPAFAKCQLVLLTQARSLHPRGQLPAYEWNFSDVNPPVHAWAALKVYQLDRDRSGVPDTVFLERVFQELILNFTWWVNREDGSGRNLFQGGFLGLDNIGLFDRGAPLANGDQIDQSDGTAWVAMYALNLMRMALELAAANHVYEDLAIKFFEHFLYIAEAMHGTADGDDTGLWDDQDGFYYDALKAKDGDPRPMRIRSVVGLIPLLAVEVLSDEFTKILPEFRKRMEWFLANRADLAGLVSHFSDRNANELRLLSLMRRDRMNRVLSRVLNEAEFLSDHGIRSLSKIYGDEHYEFEIGGKKLSIHYDPGEGTTRIYGGNSNWRGPIWMPINYLIIDALRQFHVFYGDDHVIEYPTGSGILCTLAQIADGLTKRVSSLFLKDATGHRAYLTGSQIEQSDRHFQDKLLFHEYFHGESGRGLGASHQTGWTALIALLLRGSRAQEDEPTTTTPDKIAAISERS